MSTPVLVILFAAMVGIAYLVELPWWMVAIGWVLALVGYLLERRRD